MNDYDVLCFGRRLFSLSLFTFAMNYFFAEVCLLWRPSQPPLEPKGKTVLDVGCGTGILSMFSARAGALQIFGVDNSTIIDSARQVSSHLIPYIHHHSLLDIVAKLNFTSLIATNTSFHP